MDYEKFKEQFKEALTIRPENSNIAVNLNMSKYFEACEKETDFGTIVEKAVDAIEDGLKHQPVLDVDALTDYEQMKDKLVMEVVSSKINENVLKNIPHKELEDMAVVYRFVLNSKEDGRETILVTNQMLETMDITPEQLHTDAMKNAPELKPAVIKGMSEVIAEMMGKSPEDLTDMGMSMDPSDEQMFVATVPDKIHGAGVIAYQNFMDQAAERVGGDFFILPSSIHEVLLVPDNGIISLGDLKAMVKDVNATQVAPEDKLTDSVYHYDSKDKIFELGEKFVERQEKRDAKEYETEKGSLLGDLKAKREEIAKDAPEKHAKDAAKKSRGGEAL